MVLICLERSSCLRYISELHQPYEQEAVAFQSRRADDQSRRGRLQNRHAAQQVDAVKGKGGCDWLSENDFVVYNQVELYKRMQFDLRSNPEGRSQVLRLNIQVFLRHIESRLEEKGLPILHKHREEHL